MTVHGGSNRENQRKNCRFQRPIFFERVHPWVSRMIVWKSSGIVPWGFWLLCIWYEVKVQNLTKQSKAMFLRAPLHTKILILGDFKHFWERSFFDHCTAQWSEGVTKPPWSSEQIEANLSFLEASGYILNRKVFFNILNAWITP